MTDCKLLSMAIPYQYVADEAPSYVKALTIQAGEKGANNATLSWTTPMLNYRNKTLTTIDGIKIYRNNELVKTIATTGKGENNDVERTQKFLKVTIYIRWFLTTRTEMEFTKKQLRLLVKMYQEHR